MDGRRLEADAHFALARFRRGHVGDFEDGFGRAELAVAYELHEPIVAAGLGLTRAPRPPHSDDFAAHGTCHDAIGPPDEERWRMTPGSWIRRTVVLLAWLATLGAAWLVGAYWPKGAVASSGTPPAYVGASPQDEVLPKLPGPFAGEIRRTAKDSRQALPFRVTAPKGAPNVLLVMTDDVGFGVSSTFGGPVPTPNLDRLAARGLRYTRFHTTAMCSPTRAALLTGRNSHRVGAGVVADLPSGYPGYDSAIPRSAATLGRILTGNGYSTAFFGKNHNVPGWEASAAGPFDHWTLGFEYFYGFIGGDTDQFDPVLYRNGARVDLSRKPADYILDRDLADDAIRWIRDQQAAAPDKPFLAYLATGSAHAPHQAPPEWLRKFRGQFDQGWDVVREQTLARQKQLGLVPADTSLAARPADVPAWTSLTPTQRTVAARFMETFAAAVAFQDAQFGRILDALEKDGKLDDTLVIFIEGDNGASPEGGLEGTLDEIGHLANGLKETDAQRLAALDTMGGPKTYQVYPVGWALAADTPFPYTKQVASHLGGTRNGLVISWPARIHDAGGIRTQFHHVVDILPTLLEVAGVKMPTVVDGVRQVPLDGMSLAYTFDDAKAPERRHTQYFEIFGYRAIYHDGWLASTQVKNPPWRADSPSTEAEGGPWELYDLTKDFSQTRDLAASMPEKVRELEQLWWTEAERNGVLPVNVERGLRRLDSLPLRSQMSPSALARATYVYGGAGMHVSQAAAPPLFARDFTVTADVVIPPSGATGALVAYGSWFGGWSFYLDEGRPAIQHSFSPYPQDQFRVIAARAVPAGPAKIEYDFRYDGLGLGKGGTVRIRVNGTQVAEGHIPKQVLIIAGIGETFDTGDDTGVPVLDYPRGVRRFTGTIERIAVKPGSLKLAPM